MTDSVKNPSHYQLLPGVEVKDVRAAILDKAEECRYNPTYNQIDYWSRAWEYLTRMWGKNGLEDAEKAQVYLGWLIQGMKLQQESILKEQIGRNRPVKTFEEAYEQPHIPYGDYDPT